MDFKVGDKAWMTPETYAEYYCADCNSPPITEPGEVVSIVYCVKLSDGYEHLFYTSELVKVEEA